MKLNWNFLDGNGMQSKEPSMVWGVGGGRGMVEVWTFSGTAHLTTYLLSKPLGHKFTVLASGVL